MSPAADRPGAWHPRLGWDRKQPIHADPSQHGLCSFEEAAKRPRSVPAAPNAVPGNGALRCRCRSRFTPPRSRPDDRQPAGYRLFCGRIGRSGKTLAPEIEAVVPVPSPFRSHPGQAFRSWYCVDSATWSSPFPVTVMRFACRPCHLKCNLCLGMKVDNIVFFDRIFAQNAKIKSDP